MSTPVNGGIDKIANACAKVVSKELNRMQFAATFSMENENLAREFLQQRNSNTAKQEIRSSPEFEKMLEETEKSLDRIQIDDSLKQRPLPFWRELDDEKMTILNNFFGPRNHWEEQIEWTKKGRMWPYPIDNEFLIGGEEKTSFVDHIFLETELAKYELPKSKTITHFMELVLVGLSKNPYMSVEKKREHIKWFVDYFNRAAAGKYKELLLK